MKFPPSFFEKLGKETAISKNDPGGRRCHAAGGVTVFMKLKSDFEMNASRVAESFTFVSNSIIQYWVQYIPYYL